MVLRTLLLVGMFCLPHKTGAAWTWKYGSSTTNNVPLEDNIALVVVAETNRTDAYCSTQEHKLIQDKLTASLTDNYSYSTPYKWNGGRKMQSRVQCVDKCTGFPLGLKDTHCWLVNPTCQKYARRATTTEGEEQANSPTVRRSLRARELYYNTRDYGNGFADKNGKWKSWNQLPPNALETCTAEKEKMELALPGLQNENGLSTPCKLLMKDHFAIGCLDTTQ